MHIVEIKATSTGIVEIKATACIVFECIRSLLIMKLSIYPIPHYETCFMCNHDNDTPFMKCTRALRHPTPIILSP